MMAQIASEVVYTTQLVELVLNSGLELYGIEEEDLGVDKADSGGTVADCYEGGK